MSHSAKQFRRGSLCCFINFGYRKSLDKRGGSIKFFRRNFFSQCRKTSSGDLFGTFFVRRMQTFYVDLTVLQTLPWITLTSVFELSIIWQAFILTIIRQVLRKKHHFSRTQNLHVSRNPNISVALYGWKTFKLFSLKKMQIFYVYFTFLQTLPWKI